LRRPSPRSTPVSTGTAPLSPTPWCRAASAGKPWTPMASRVSWTDCRRQSSFRSCRSSWDRCKTAEGQMAKEVCAHITGTVWKIEVKVGDSVKEGDTVVILESMKMEMPVESTATGKVREIKVKESEAVQEGQALVVLE